MNLDKPGIRKEARRRLGILSTEERLAKSRTILGVIEAEPGFRAARTVLVYASMPEEVATDAIAVRAMAQGKTVLVPRLGPEGPEVCRVSSWEKDLRVQGLKRFREPEPALPAAPLDGIDWVLVPGLAFTRDGRRVGRGGGFYDQLLPKLPAGVFSAGLAYDIQIFESLPVEPHDQRVDKVYWA